MSSRATFFALSLAILAAQAAYVEFDVNFDKCPVEYGEQDTMRMDVKINRNGETAPLTYVWIAKDLSDNTEITNSWGGGKMTKTPLPADERFTVEFKSGKSRFVKFVLRVINEQTGGGAGEIYKYAGFGIDSIKPLAKPPRGYQEHWKKLLKELSEEPIRFSRMDKVKCSVPGYSIYDVRLPCPGGAEVSGMLSIPDDAAPGTLPAAVYYYGYCVEGVYGSSLEKRINAGIARDRIWLQINAHGIENNREAAYYHALEGKGGRLCNYGFDTKANGLHLNDNPDTCYFRGMMQRAIRAAEAFRALPQWDGKNLELIGGSQGGMQALTAAAFVPAVSKVTVTKPWFADVKAYSTFRPAYDTGMEFYDVNHLAPFIKAPVTMSIGLYDEICSPHTLMSLAGMLRTDRTVVFQYGGHSAEGNFVGFHTNSYPRTVVLPAPERRIAPIVPVEFSVQPEYIGIRVDGTESVVEHYATLSDVPGTPKDIRWKTDWMLFRRIPGGAFTRADGSATYSVKPFYCGVYEVTQQQWEYVAVGDYLPKSHPSRFINPQVWRVRPVESLAFNAVRGMEAEPLESSFLGKLRELTGGAMAFDLPTEGQWEKACGLNAPLSRTMSNSGCGPRTNNDSDPLRKLDTFYVGPEKGTAPVGSYEPNEYGLYDMLGNVLEFCRDGYNKNIRVPYDLQMGDGDKAAPFGGRITSKGGAWCFPDDHATPVYRADSEEMRPRYGHPEAGFRVVFPSL